MSETRPVCAIVDAWSTGRYLYPAFAAAGWDCVHVWSRAQPPEASRISYAPHPFLAEFFHDGDIERTLALVAGYRPRYFIPGTESGVPLADALAAKSLLVGNDPRMSAARRNKYLMAEAVRARGLRAVEHCAAGRADDVVRWAVERDRWPVVVKPPSSAGTDNVHICGTAGEVRRAADLVLRSNDFLGDPNEGVLVQGFLQGVEYVVNTVSWEGVHRFTEMWRCTKQQRGSAQLYDVEELLPFDGPRQSEIVPYVVSVLDALEIEYGPAHMELICTEEGPTLVEVGARMHGSIDRAAVAACVDQDHVTATVSAYTRPAEFLAQARRPYRLRQHSLCVILMSHRSGRLAGMPGATLIRDLPSYYSTLMFVKTGEQIRTTVDLWTAPGGIYLVHPDPDVLWRDYRRIREIERTELFSIVP